MPQQFFKIAASYLHSFHKKIESMSPPLRFGLDYDCFDSRSNVIVYDFQGQINHKRQCRFCFVCCNIYTVRSLTLTPWCCNPIHMEMLHVGLLMDDSSHPSPGTGHIYKWRNLQITLAPNLRVIQAFDSSQLRP